MDDIETLSKNIAAIQKNLGLSAALICLIILLALFFLWHYLKRKIEKSAEISSEKILKRLQIELDKELQEFSIRLSHRYQNQTKAIEEVYVQFAALTSYLDFLNEGDKYEEQTKPFEDYETLINYRRNFINLFEQRKIYIPEAVNQKIIELLPVLEAFIDTYKSGFFPPDSTLEYIDRHTNETFILAGLWNQNKFNLTISAFKGIQNELERLFRKVTND